MQTAQTILRMEKKNELNRTKLAMDQKNLVPIEPLVWLSSFFHLWSHHSIISLIELICSRLVLKFARANGALFSTFLFSNFSLLPWLIIGGQRFKMNSATSKHWPNDFKFCTDRCYSALTSPPAKSQTL